MKWTKAGQEGILAVQISRYDIAITSCVIYAVTKRAVVASQAKNRNWEAEIPKDSGIVLLSCLYKPLLRHSERSVYRTVKKPDLGSQPDGTASNLVETGIIAMTVDGVYILG